MQLIEDLRALVEIESPSDDPSAVGRAAAWARDRLQTGGVSAALRECPPRGPALIADTSSASPSSSGAAASGSLLLGHLDTVWPLGTLADLPFRITEEHGRRIARGPGVFDMKAGCVVAIHALLRRAASGDTGRVGLLLVPDEEVGSEASRGLLVDFARTFERVLVLEPSAPGGAAKVARKGTGLYRLEFQGVSSHAGLDPEKGASALAALAEFVRDAPRVQDAAKGTTVTPTVASAGARTNVVPERADVAVDCRVWTADESERVDRAIAAWRPSDPRVRVAVSGGFDRPPLEQTAEAARLFETARAIASELGFDLGSARVGGASDGNLTSAAGVPTLDGLGPEGDGAHARHEHIVVDDLERRVALVERLLRAVRK